MDVNELIRSGDAEGIAAFMQEYDLVFENGKIVARDDVAKKKSKAMSEFYDSRQQCRKIL